MIRPFHLVACQTALPGILGGLGPLAHIKFEQRLIEKSALRGAQCDQDHPVWILVGATDTPDRTKSLRGEVENCAPWLLRYSRVLEAAGANFLVVTCNTAHAFYEQVQPQLRIPWISLMACTTEHILQTYPTVLRVGVLATDGTLQAELYSRSLQQAGLLPILMPMQSPQQNRVMQAIYHPEWGIKSTGNRVSFQALAVLEQAAHWLWAQGAEILIAGCTELSVGLANINLPIPWVDPLEAMADITLDLAYGHRSLHSLQAA